MKRLSSVFRTGSTVAKAGSEAAEHSGRWVRLTAESAQAIKKYDLMTGSQSDYRRAVLTDHGKIAGLLEIVRTPSAMLTDPALLTGAAGLMAQLAMKQTMDEITEYLAVIDAKVEDVLRAQTDAVVADMIGVELVIDEARTIRDQVDRVSEITWSKVQATPVPLARTQAYAVRQLDAIAGKLETQSKVGDLARMDAAAGTANAKVLLNPTSSRAVVHSANRVETTVVAFTSRLGLERDRRSRDARRWLDAAAEVRDKVVETGTDVKDKALETGAEGVGAASRFGVSAFDRAKSMMGKVSGDITDRAQRQLGSKEES